MSGEVAVGERLIAKRGEALREASLTGYVRSSSQKTMSIIPGEWPKYVGSIAASLRCRIPS